MHLPLPHQKNNYMIIKLNKCGKKNKEKKLNNKIILFLKFILLEKNKSKFIIKIIQIQNIILSLNSGNRSGLIKIISKNLLKILKIDP